MRLAKTLMTALVAGAVLSAPGTAFADHEFRDLCAGVYEIDGCWYCTYQSSPFSSPVTYCHYGFGGYSWEQCRVWVNSVCVEGSI